MERRHPNFPQWLTKLITALVKFLLLKFADWIINRGGWVSVDRSLMFSSLAKQVNQKVYKPLPGCLAQSRAIIKKENKEFGPITDAYNQGLLYNVSFDSLQGKEDLVSNHCLEQILSTFVKQFGQWMDHQHVAHLPVLQKCWKTNPCYVAQSLFDWFIHCWISHDVDVPHRLLHQLV